jgi:hypothetical protein
MKLDEGDVLHTPGVLLSDHRPHAADPRLDIISARATIQIKSHCIYQAVA